MQRGDEIIFANNASFQRKKPNPVKNGEISIVKNVFAETFFALDSTDFFHFFHTKMLKIESNGYFGTKRNEITDRYYFSIYVRIVIHHETNSSPPEVVHFNFNLA